MGVPAFIPTAFGITIQFHVGKINKDLDEGPKRGRSIVSMKDDWETVFPPDKK